MNLNNLILNALQQGHVVVLPGLGSLRTRTESAQVHPVKHTFTPPHTYLIFDVEEEDENIFLNSIAKEENVSIEKAKEALSAHIVTIKENLASNSRYEFGNWGVLTKNKDASFTVELQHEVVINPYLTGLSEFTSPAIKRGQSQNAATKVVKKRKSRKLLVVLGVLLVLAALGVSSYFIFPEIAQKQITHVQSFIIKNKERLLSRDTDKKDPGKKLIAEEVAPERKDDGQSDIEPPIEKEPETYEAPIAEAMEEETFDIIDDTSRDKYFIVAGSFRERGNAEAYVEELKAGAYKNARMLDKQRGGFYIVVFEGFANSTDAQNKLHSIVDKGHAGAWILTK